jgi:hypothetical protein
MRRTGGGLQARPRSLAAERLVDLPRHRASAHSPGVTAGEGRPRTHAPYAQGRRLSAPAREPRGPATGLQSLPHALQRRTAARLPRRPRAQLLLPRLPSTLPQPPAPARGGLLGYAAASSSACRTLFVSAAIVNGFGRNATSACRTPCPAPRPGGARPDSVPLFRCERACGL